MMCDCAAVVLCCTLEVVKEYQMPFEAEVGLHPSLEDMQDMVVTSKQRPQFSADWMKDVVSSC